MSANLDSSRWYFVLTLVDFSLDFSLIPSPFYLRSLYCPLLFFPVSSSLNLPLQKLAMIAAAAGSINLR